MKKLFFVAIFLTLTMVVPQTTLARVDVQIGIGIPLPPAIVFSAPPALIVIPDTYVYAVPDIEEDIFFYNGWWWRSWEGHWYRSHNYDRGWTYYKGVPSFYHDVDPHWRGYYRDHNWYGHRWNYERIPQQQLQKNWKNWKNNRYWEGYGSWGVQSYKPLTQQQRREVRDRRQEQYRQTPWGQQQPRQQLQPQKTQPQPGKGQPQREMKPQSHQQRSQEVQQKGERERGGYEKQDRR